MAGQTNGFSGSKFETLESRMMLTGAFPSAAQNAIVYDTKGNLDVAYYDSTAHNLKYVQEAANGTWSQPVVIDGSSSDVGKYVTIAINGQGFPAVAYQDTANADLKYAVSNGTSWTTTVADKRKTTGFNPSLTFDSAGEALISYYKQNTGDLDLATLKGKKWTLTTLQSKGNVGQDSSIAINPATGKVAVAYSNATGQVQYVSAAAKGKTYSKPVTIGTTTGTASNVSLAFSGTSAAVGYVDPTSGKVDLGQLAGKTVTTTNIATITPGAGSGAEVLIDPSTHQPAVVYHDSTGVYVAAPSTGGAGFQTTQVSTDGTNSVATVQPGSGSIVFSTVNTTGGTLSVNTTVAPPNAPTNVAAAGTSTSTATITWTDNSTNEAGFLIERSTDNVNFTTVATTQPNITTFADTGLTEGTLYYYRVSALGAAGNNTAGTTGSGGSQIVSAAGVATAITIPAAPTAVAASPVNDTSITVTWTNSSNNPTGFIINRSTDGGTTWTQAGTAGATVATFTDSGLTEATAYSYQVIAFNSTGGSTSGAAATHTLAASPSNVTATATSDTAITITWKDNSAAATGFVIQRGTDGINFTSAGSASASASSFSDTGLTESTAYYYRVLASGPGNLNSAPSTQANALTDPTAPSNVTVTAVSSTLINVAWTDPSTGATQYIVQRSANGGAFATIATLDGSARSFPDSGRTEGVSYTYQVEALTGSVASGFSPQVTTTPLPPPPTQLTAAANGLSVTLNWKDNSISETGFTVQRSSDNGVTWGSVGPAPANSGTAASFADTTVMQGTTYLYQVAAFNVAGSSAFSNAPGVTIIPAKPTGLTATAASATQVNLHWIDHSLGETGIKIERSADNGNTWTTVTTTAAQATSYPDMGLSAATSYMYRISAVNAGGASDYATATALTAPTAPGNITATAASTTEVDVNWAPTSGATSYIVQRSTDGTTWTPFNAVTATTLSDTNLTEGTTYQYTVTAVNAGGSSTAGGPVSGSTLPAVPDTVAATGINPESVLVTWHNNSRGATGFVIQRSPDGGTSWYPVGTVAGTQSSITDSAAQEATAYTYQVQAVDAGGNSAFVASSQITTIPLAPSNLTATVSSATTVSLNWLNNSAGAANYIVQRSTDGENYGQIGSVSGSTHAFTDTQATAATLYWYRVYALDAGGPSDYSNAPQATTTPAVPQNVAAQATSATVVGLTWNAVTGATGYNILRSTDNVTFTSYGTSPTNSFTDTGAVESTQYWYEIEATNGSGPSTDSQAATATTAPSAPMSLGVTSTTDTQVVLSWMNTSHAVTNFKIERSTDNGTSFSQIDTTAGNVTTYTDTQVSEGSHYIYRVRATGAGGDGAASATVGADTNPSAPTNLALSATSATGVTISWTDVSTEATNYIVARSDDGGSTFSIIATLSGTATSYNDTVTEGTAHVYEVRATQTLVDGVTTVRSTWTATQSITAPPAAPSNAHAVSISASEVDVTWTNNSANETGFKIYRSTDNTVWSFLGSALSTDSSYQDLTASAGTMYYYRVRATNTGGDSAPSNSSALTSIPAAPGNVNASTSSNPNISITWDDVAGETGFAIQRSNDGGTTWADLATTGQGVAQYTDTTSAEDQTYTYQVQATNSSGGSAFSSTAQASTFLAAPSNLTIAATSAIDVDLSWTDHSSAATTYEVQRSSDNGTTWQSVTTSVAGTAHTFSDTTVVDGTAYLYQVRGLNAGGNSDFSPTASTNTTLLAPTGLTTQSISTTQINLSWTNPSATATGFQIWRSTDGGTTYTQLDVTSGQTTYSDHAISTGQSVSYEIFATNSLGTSPASTPTAGYGLPTAPSDLQAEPASSTTINLSWQDNSNGSTGYQVWRSDDGGGDFSLITTVSGASADSYSDTSLTEASHYVYRVYAVNGGGSSGSSNIAASDTFCADPTNLAATAISDSSINLTWTNNTQGADGYGVLISTDNGANYDLVTGSLSPTANSYTVNSLTEATNYLFFVFAYNGVGTSETADPVSQTTLAASPTLQTATAQSDGVHLTWQDNSAGSTGFEVERSDDGGATFPNVFAIASGQSTYVDTTAAANTSYVYQIVTKDGAGDSAASSAQTVLSFPAAPTNFGATSPTSSSASLTWTPDANGADHYDIQRSLDGENFTYLDTIDGPASSYTDTTAVAGTTYTYQLIAVNSHGDMAAPVASAVNTLTAAPTGVATTLVHATSVSLTWNDVLGEAGFTIQRSTDNATWTTVGTSGGTSFTDTSASEATSYYYQVAGTNASGTGDYSTSLSVLTTPSAPSMLIATPVSATEVDLSWTDTSHDARDYLVYRSTNGGGFVQIAQGLAATATSYNDTTASAGTNYTYRVYADNVTGVSMPTDQTALTIPAQPQSFNAVGASPSEIDLTWHSVATATQYTIQRSPNGSTNWTLVGQTSTLGIPDTGLTEGTTYYYSVTASNATGSGPAATTNAPTLPAAVTSLQATSPSATEVDLSWMDNSAGATGYNLYKSTDNGQTFTTLTTLNDPAADSYTDTVAEGTAYTYRVAPIDSSGEGAASDASVTTVPAAPTLASATPASDTEVDLTWTNNSAHATGFTVERTDFGQNDWSTLSSDLAATVTTFADTTALGGTQYQYKVIAQGPGDNSADSNVIATLTYASAVSTLQVNTASSTEIDLSWTAVNGADNYKILRSTDNITFAQVDEIDSSATTYQDTDGGTLLAEGTRYYYQVVASNGTGDSATGNTAFTSTLAAAPSELAAQIISNHEIDLSWTNNSAGQTAVGVERSTNNSTWTLIDATDTATAHTYQDTNVVGGHTYYYRVSAIDEGGTNYMSDVASITALSIPDAPTISATPLTDGTVSLSWTAPTGAATYTVQSSTDESTWSAVVTGTAMTSAIDSNAAGNTTTYYRVQAINAGGSGAFGSDTSALTVPTAPSSLNASAVSATEIDLSWTGDTSANVTYNVYRSLSGGSPHYVKIGTTTAATTLHDTGVSAGTSYVYEVAVVNASGQNVTPAFSSDALTFPAAPASLGKTVISGTEVDLTWTLSTGATTYTVERSTDGMTWTNLTMSALDGTAAGFNDTGASAGVTYTYRVTAIDASGSNASTISATTYPASPTNLTPTVVDNHDISVQWNSVTGATSYTLQRSPDGGTNWSNVSGISGTGVTDSVAGGGTYTYRVKATDSTGDSAYASAMAITVVPDAPTGVSATATSDVTVEVTWTLSSGATHYDVMRSDDNGMTWSDASGTLSSSTASFDDSSLTELTPYQYKVIASNTAGNSADSTAQSLVTLPTAPSDLALDSQTTSSVNLTWTDNSNGDAAFDIERSTDGTMWSMLDSTDTGVTTYSDTTAAAGTTYDYRVKADNGSVISAPSTSIPVLTLPGVPANILTGPGADSVTVSWDEVQSADSYTVYRKTGNGMYGQLATDIESLNYFDGMVVGGTTYTYKVVATNVSGDGDAGFSSAVVTAPDAPTNLTATGVSSGEIDLQWTDSTGATSYEVDRENLDNTWTVLTTSLASNATTYADTGLAGGTQQTYEVYAINATGRSPASTPETGLTAPDAPTNVSATPINAGEVDLTWDAMTGADTYTITVSTDGGNSYNALTDSITGTSYADTSAVGGTDYQYQVVAVNVTGNSDSAGTSNEVLTVPAAQTDISATPVNASEVDLSWTDVTGATSYTIERKTGAGGFSPLTAPALAGTAQTFHDTTVASGTTYTYEIFGTDATGDSVATPTSSVLTVPAAVTITTTTIASTSEIDLAWTADTGTVTGYRVYRSDDEGMTFNQLGMDLANTATTFADTGLTDATDYIYRVVAFNGTGHSANSDTDTLTTLAIAPTDFAAAGVSTTEVDLSWDASNGATGYEIDRQNEDMSWSPLTTSLTGTDLSFADTGLDGGTSYTYRVEALDAGGASIPTDPQSGLTAPAAPTNVAATPISAGEVDLTWDAMTGADTYTITVSTDGGTSYSALTDSITGTTYADTSTVGGTNYQYQIVAVNVTGNSDSAGTSNEVLTIPAAQSDLAATPISATEVDLSWTDVTGATSYTIERKTGAGSYSPLTAPTVAGNVHTFHDTTVASGTTYTYEIFGTDATGDSIATTHNALTVPAAVTITNTIIASTSEIDLAWTADTGTVTGYRVYRSDDEGMTFNQLGMDLANTVTTFADTGLTDATDYIYRVVAFNATGHSGNSDTNTLTTLPETPTSFAAVAVSNSEVDLSWDSVERATGYEIDVQNEDLSWSLVTNDLTGTDTSFADTSLAGGTSYTYRIEALDAGGASISSDPQTALTIPDAPTNVAASPISAGEVDLSWDAMTGADTYTVTVSTDGGTTYNDLADSLTGTSYADTSVTGGTGYIYQVVAIDDTGTSDPGTSNATLTVPAAQGDFAKTVISATEVDLSWTDVTGATSYTIERKTGAGSYSPLTTPALASNIQSFHDTSAQGATSYTYEIFGTDATGNSAVTTQTALTVPSAVSITTTTVVGTGEIDLAWTSDTGTVSGYRVLRSDDNGMTFNQLGSDLPSTATSYQDMTPDPATPYIYRVLAFNGTGHSGNSDTNVLTTYPSTPANFSATDISATEIDLGWDTVSGATGYEVDRLDIDGITWDTQTTSLTAMQNSYQDTGLDGATQYSYRVEAIDVTGNSDPTETESALTIPAAPATVTATPITATDVHLTWDAVDGADTYTITKNPDAGGYTSLASGVTGTSYDFSNAAAGTAYTFKVTAVDPTGPSLATTSNAISTIPATPTNFAANTISSTEIDLGWDPMHGATSYEVDRLDIDGHTWDTLTTSLTAMQNSYQDTVLDTGTSYSYRVEAIDATGSSIATSTATTSTLPDVVQNLKATAVSGNEVDLSWSSTNGATGYHILVSTDGGMTFNPLTDSVSTSYQNTGLTEGTDYQYEIVASGISGDGAATDPADVTTYLNTPGLAVTAVSQTSITLQWTNHSLADIGYEVDQETTPGHWVDIDDDAAITNDGDTGSFTVTGLTEATNYAFRVEATGNVLPSVPAVVTPSTVPNDPTGIAATPISTTSIGLTWTNNSANADSYEVDRSSDNGSTWSQIDSIPGTSQSYTDTTAIEATAYKYQVAAIKGLSESDFDTTASVTSLPLAPTDLTPTVISATEIDLNWTDNSANPSAYRVYNSTDGGNTWSQLGSDLSSSATTYDDTSAAENATTYYKVVAVDAGGESAGTAITNATTPLAAPTSVVAATTSSTSTGDKTINLTWTNNSTVNDGVKVERSSDGMTWTALTTLAATATSYADDTGLENTAYTYRVYSTDGGVSSTHTASNSITTLLSRPTSLSLSSPTASSVTLNWTDISSAATSYHVERSTDGVSFSDIATILSASANSYTDGSPSEGTLYYYRVRAVSDGNTSNYSAIQSVTTLPATPTSLSATPFSTTEIDLSWTDVSTTNTSYTVERSLDAGADWSVVTSALAGTANAFSDTGLTEGTDYEYEIFATGTGGNSAFSNTSATPTLPAAPSALTFSSSTASSVAMTWTDNSNGVTNYSVERSTDGTTWTVLTTSLSSTATSYTDTTPTEGTAYLYRVRGNRNGTESAYTSNLNVTTQPAAPSNLTVSSFTSSKVTLGWTDNSNGETGFKVVRSSDGGNTWSIVGSPGANSTAFSDNTVSEGLSYIYYVYALNAGGNSTNSTTTSASIPPAAPTGLTSSNVSANSVTLTWTNHSSHQTGFFVEKSTNGGTSFTQIADVTSGVTYTDTSTSESSSYQYRVRAHGSTGNSSYSSSIAVTTPVNAPTNLTATTISTTEIDLSWTDNSNAESGYSLQQSTDNGVSWTTTISLPANTTSYQNTALTEGSTYTYRLQATRTGKNSAFTGNQSATTLPATPSSVTAVAASDTQVTVSWTNNSIGVTGFTVQRSTDGVNWTTVGTVNGSTTSFGDTGLTELTAYSYRVKASDTGGSSPYATTSGTVTSLPAAPSNLTLSAPASDRVALSWTDNSAGATGYKVERNDGGGWVQIAVLPSSANSYTDLTVDEATQYSYRVRTVANSLNSAYSNAPSFTTVPLDPDTLVATTASTSEIDLAWNDNSTGATNYLVERSLDGGNTWTQIVSLDGNATSYNDTGLIEGTDYQYRVRAQDAGGFSGYTPSADATTLPAAPDSFTATPSTGQIALAWNDNSNGELSYTVERNNGGTWTPVASLDADSTSFTDTGATGGLVSGHTYQYRVFCSSAGGDSTFASTAATAT